MVQLRGNEFADFSILLGFEGRYLIVESAVPDLLVTIVCEHNSQPVFEVLKNQPCNNPLSTVTMTPSGTLTAEDRQSGRFLYEVRPGTETSFVYRTSKAKDVRASFTDRNMSIHSMPLDNLVFFEIFDDGTIGNTQIPEAVIRWFSEGISEEDRAVNLSRQLASAPPGTYKLFSAAGIGLEDKKANIEVHMANLKASGKG